jgi:neutral ceramidase
MTRPLLPMTFVLLAAAASSPADQAENQDGRFPVASNLKAGVAKVDITPDVGGGLLISGHTRTVHEVRDPLRAGVLVLDNGEAKAALVTMDTIGAWDDMVKLAREEIEEETGVPAANILIAASHNHSGPAFEADSKWGRELISKLGTAAKQASDSLRPVTIGYGEDKIGFGINRRKVIDGRAVFRLNPDGPNDPRVKVLRFDDGQSLTPVAVIMHAV